jgi:CPA2 family monovalent cation:H+ antiporter-2
MHLLQLTWVTLPANSPLIGQTIQAIAIRSLTGASVVGVMRDGNLHPNPNANYRFASGDLLAVMGNVQQLAAFQTLI